MERAVDTDMVTTKIVDSIIVNNGIFSDVSQFSKELLLYKCFSMLLAKLASVS